MEIIQEQFTIDINVNGDFKEVINDLIKRKIEGDLFVKILLASNDPVYEFECWERVLSRPEFTEWVTLHNKDVAHGFKGCFIVLKIPYKYKTVMYPLGVEFTKEFAKGNIKKLSSRLAFALKEQNKLNEEQTDLIKKFVIDNLQLFLQ